MGKNQARNFEWATVAFEDAAYDVCVCMVFEQANEIRPVDSEINIIEIMDRRSIEWMYKKAMEEIEERLNTPYFNDMSRMEYLIDESTEITLIQDKTAGG
jgi:hypothetical protein